MSESHMYVSVSCQQRASLPVRGTGEVRGQEEGSAVCFASSSSFVCSSAVCFFCILSFNVILFPQVARWASLHFPLSSSVHAPSFISLLSLPPSCWHAPSPPRRTHTRIDLTISAIQPPKSNYHGHNAVIKSNGLLDEAPTLKLNKSFSTLLHIILCATLPGTMNCVHSAAYNLFNFTELYLKLFHTVEQHHINSNTLFSSCLCGFLQFPPTAGKNCKLAFSASEWSVWPVQVPAPHLCLRFSLELGEG